MIHYELEEIKLTPRQSAMHTYQFICDDLAEGLNCSIATELINKCMEGIGSNFRTEQPMSARDFANKFYEEGRKRDGTPREM